MTTNFIYRKIKSKNRTYASIFKTIRYLLEGVPKQLILVSKTEILKSFFIKKILIKYLKYLSNFNIIYM